MVGNLHLSDLVGHRLRQLEVADRRDHVNCSLFVEDASHGRYASHDV